MEMALIKTGVQELTDMMVEFNRQWPNYVTDAEVYRLPLLPEQKVPPIIEPKKLVGADAVDAAKTAFAQFYRETGQHAATVMRLPGCIVLSKDMVEVVDDINKKKDEIRGLVHQLPENSRAYYIRNALSGLSLLQVYRTIHAWPQCPRRVLFSWAGKSSANTHRCAREVIAELERARPHAPEHVRPENWQKMIDIEVKRIGSLSPDCLLLFRRQIAPHPRAMIYLSEGAPEGKKTPYDAMIHANLPLIVTRKDNTPIQISPLQRFDAQKSRKIRKDKRQMEALIPEIGLYLPG